MMTGQRIRDSRKEKRLSQTELADVVHVSQQTITAWENDKAEPSSSVIAALAIQSGINPKETQAQLGHSNIQTTLQIYTAVTDEQRMTTPNKFTSFVNF